MKKSCYLSESLPAFVSNNHIITHSVYLERIFGSQLEEAKHAAALYARGRPKEVSDS